MIHAVALRALSSLLGGALVAAGPVIVAPPGTARPSCPSATDLETALQTRFPGAVRPADIEPAAGQLRLATSYGPGILRLEIRSERGDVLLRRVLPRDDHEQDCRALAESVALIVDRYVHAIAAEAPPPPAATPASPPTAAPVVPAPPPPERATSNPPPSPPTSVGPPPRVETPPESEPAAAGRPPQEETRDETPARPPPPSASLRPAARREMPATDALHAANGAAYVLGLLGGERFGNGSPATSEEGRLSLERFSHWRKAGWLAQLQMGLARAGAHTDGDVGALDLWRFPARLAVGLIRPLGLGQLETSLGLGGDLLLRVWTSPAGSTARNVRFAPLIDWTGSFRAALSERLALSLGVSVGWSLVRYDLGFTTNGRSINLLQTPRLSVTPALGLSIAFM